MNRTIDLQPEHRAIVLDILRAHLPPAAKVWVFGSRASGRARRGSDLDLAIDLGQALPSDIEYDLKFAFEDSDLPWTVDVLDWWSVGDGIFRQNVERERLLLNWQAQQSK